MDTFFLSIPVHPIYGGQEIPIFRSMSDHFWRLDVLLSILSGAYPFTDCRFSFSRAYPFHSNIQLYLCVVYKTIAKAKVISSILHEKIVFSENKLIISAKVSHHSGKVSHLQKLGGFVCKCSNII